MTIVDASTVVRLLSNEILDELLRKRLSPPRRLHAPELIDAEVLNSIRGLVLGGKITRAAAMTALDQFIEISNIVRHSAIPYLRRALELRNNLTAYDALYVALAEKLRLPLLTRDAKIAGASGHKADVQVYP